MKKLAVIAVATALAGCASEPQTTQIVSSSTEEVYTETQLRSKEAMQPATEEIAVAETPVKEETTATKVIKKAAEEDKQIAAVKADKEEVSEFGYTIQVLALSHNKGFTTYMNKLPSDKPVWMNKKDVKGVPWYTLLYGQFDTKAEARKALNALPKDVRDFGPFIRSIDQIKVSTSPKLTKLN
ncbi:DamX-related protein [Photobacterium sanctipauli]|uniref:DamX-related protein n=1 Tax=Photobacterium sanctipauli TaxID=1342794 RepID=A0A2T3NVC3_9GAMM|nr:SPOR domain-containing protein [Photobacterium sanctipauli]PSW20233.1 DamX-related protein [Photobacterium sanctipauli]